MSNQTPIQINGCSHFKINRLELPLDKITSFWVRDAKTHVITLHCCTNTNEEIFSTIFHLHLENKENMHASIRQLLSNPKMTAVFSARSAMPLIIGIPNPLKPGEINAQALVEIDFTTSEDLEYFKTYGITFLHEFSLIATGTKNDMYFATLQYREINQTEKINQVFLQMMHSLNTIANPNPSTVNNQSTLGITHNLAVYLDHVRIYEIDKSELTECLPITENDVCKLPAQAKDVEQWLADPTLQKGKQIENYRKCIVQSIQKIIQQKPIDNERLRPLINAALSIPGFDISKMTPQLPNG